MAAVALEAANSTQSIPPTLVREKLRAQGAALSAAEAADLTRKSGMSAASTASIPR
jgi:hypothetical protein